MKGKPAKLGKSSKNNKKQEDVVVELTPKQLKEKRREEARARAAETRKIVTSGVGQWTGKLPAQLLNEHAQKNKWERVDYPHKNKGSDDNPKFVCSVILAKRNAKTKEIEKIRFDPPDTLYPPQATALEARHLAATYTMHRVMPSQNMKMMLPPFHRDIWIAMDEIRSQASKFELYQWNDDPWLANAEKKAARAKAAEMNEQRKESRERSIIAREIRAGNVDEKVSEDKNVAEKLSSNSSNVVKGGNGSKRIKFNHVLSLSKKTRAVLESVIRENNGYRFSEADGLDSKSEEFQRLSKMLQKLGFRKPFSEEALQQTSSLSSALAWLLVHVPEDDIPKEFMPSDLNVTARISSGLESERIISQLRTFGYSEDVALSTASECASLEKSVVQLTHAFLSTNQNDFKDVSPSDYSMWTEDVESLQAVIEQPSSSTSSSLSVTLEEENVKVTFFCPHDYPNQVPGIAFEPLKVNAISKFVLLAATRDSAEFVQSELLGDYMLLSLYEHIRSVFGKICANPGKLSSISSAVSGVKDENIIKNDNGNKRKHKHNNVHIDTEKVLKERKQRMTSLEGQRMMQQREQLPAWKKRTEIVDLVQNHQLLLLTGETGSGKSTQAVQFILDAVPDAQIICTQPRRISAIGVAQRVAEERLVEIGTEVGYVIKGESKSSSQTQIKFVTSGVLLRMLQDADNSFSSLTHVFVDEVHERSLDSDFLLILLKRLLKKLPKLKVILMSATIDAKQFLSYFKPLKTSTVHVEGRTFPVQQFFLDDVVRLTNYRPKNLDTDSQDVGKIIAAIRESSKTRIDYDLVAALISSIDQKLGREEGSILVFMSGTAEIEQTIQAIEKIPQARKNLYVLPLHASLSSNEQRRVFKAAPKNMRKVVVSTNVAETSITISDIVAVVDSGRVKETQYDSTQNACRLVDVMESQASAAQRMGRAGRVRAGEGYKLFTKNTQETRMAPRPLPEIQRSPLEVLYLRVKSMGIADVEKFLSSAMDPPPDISVNVAKENLVAYKMLDLHNNTLTPLGKLVSTIPSDPKTGKLLVLGTIFACLPRILTISAIISYGKMPPLEENKNGDLLAAAEPYHKWKNGNALQGSAAICRSINATRAQLLSSLVQTGLVPSGVKECDWSDEYVKYDNDDALVRAVIGASLQPSLAEVVAPKDVFVSTSSGAVRKEDDDAKNAKLFLPNGTRVFAHPRSVLWSSSNPGASLSMPYVSFSQTVLTSKHFIADLTPFSICSLVLFATRVDVDPFGNGVVVDNWTGLKCWPRIGIVLRCLQTLLAELFDLKFSNPEASLSGNTVLALARDLLVSEDKSNGVGLLAN